MITGSVRVPLRACGRPYPTAEEAGRSKAGQFPGAVVELCWIRECGKWHVRQTATPRVSAVVVPLRTGRYTGPDRLTRETVLKRDGYRCVCCGASVIGEPYSLQHRKRRSQGGGNSPSNLVTVLGTGSFGCHWRIDSREFPADEKNGYSVRSWKDPAMVPVLIVSEHGSEVLAWLTDVGGLAFEAPAGAA